MPMYDFECSKGHVMEGFWNVADLPKETKCVCGRKATLIITSPPALHTLASFSKDIDDEVVRRTRDPGDGSYVDPNLSRDRKTGKITRITSRKHREELMKAKGLSEFGETDLSRDTARLKKTRPFHVGAGGPNRRAHG